MGWQPAAPFGVTTYVAEVLRDALPPAVLARAPGATGGLYVRGQADMTAEDVERLKRLASGSVDELSIGYEAVKVAFEQNGDRHIRRLKEVKLYEWSPVWVAMNPAALITGVKGASEAGGAGTIDPGEHDGFREQLDGLHRASVAPGYPGASGIASMVRDTRQYGVPRGPREDQQHRENPGEIG